MITTVTNDRCYEFRGLASDTKPTEWGGKSISNGSIFFVIDTCEVFMFDEASKTWVKLG